VDDRIRPTLESGTSVGGTKPVLVVIDEIDGATGGGENVCVLASQLLSLLIPASWKSSGFIQKLVQLTYDKTTKKGPFVLPDIYIPF
jgi:chromosome transmission fidelity protein 18